MTCSKIVSTSLNVDERKVSETIIRSSIHNNEVSISEITIKNLTKENFIEVFSDMIISGEIGFPWKKYFVGDPYEKFQNLSNYTPQISTQPYRFTDVKAHFSDPFIAYITSNRFFLNYKTCMIIISNDQEYIDMNVLSDIFQEPARLKSVAGFIHPAPLEMWKMKKYHTFLDGMYEAACESPQGLDTYLLREEFYKVSRLSEASSFKPTIAKSLYMFLGAKRILDFSSGWGDRLLGALSLQDEIEYYIATDPNGDLYDGYRNMIQLAKPENRGKYRMHHMPFEDFDLNLKYNCVFTSPPYFDYERYGDSDSKQSISSNPSFEGWVVNFLLASLKKAWSYLEVGGYLALNISDSYQLVQKNTQFTEITLLLIHAYLPGVEYNGVLSFAGSAKSAPRPIWTFRKLNTNRNVSNINKAVTAIQKYYPKVWKFMN